MSAAAIAADFHQTFDVQGFLTAEVTFYFVFMIQNFTELAFKLSPIRYGYPG